MAAELTTPMQQRGGNIRLDAPPPLPTEARRRVPGSALMPGPMSLGPEAQSPMIQLLDISKQMEALIQKAQTVAPQLTDQWAALLSAFGQATAQALSATAQPPGVGAPANGMMAPPMPMPPMGAGAPGGQQV